MTRASSPAGDPAALAGPRPAPARPADLVFLGGPCYSADAARSWTDGLAVSGRSIRAVGARAARALTGPGTRVVNLAGRLLLPGFIDAHVHPVMGGAERLRCDLTGCADAGQAVARVAAYAAAHPEAAWITGGGWAMDQFPGGTPHRRLLDAVVPDRPVFLVNRDHHDAWCNSAALALAGVDRATPDPRGGRIARDADGSPAGTLHEEAADLVGRHSPRLSEDDYVEALLEGQRYLHSFGITGWQDAIVGAYLGYDDLLPAYLRAAREHLLTGHVAGALWWDRNRGLEQIDELVERRASAALVHGDGTGRFRAGTVKIMQDGICENLTAAMLTPYLTPAGQAPSSGSAQSPGQAVSEPTRGHSYLDPKLLAEAVTRLDALGFQVHVHAIGDRGVREALDAFEAARDANGVAGPGSSSARPGEGADSGSPAAGSISPNRHHIAHLQVVHPADVPRFRALGVTATMQPLWAADEPQMRALNAPVLGPERYGWQYPFGELHRTGAMLAAGSDWPVTSPDPLAGIHVAVNRVQPDAPAGTEAFLPHQALALGDALAAYTIGSARVCHADARTGSLEVGKDADLVLLDRDVFAGPPEQIARARALMTVAAGRVVHDLVE